MGYAAIAGLGLALWATVLFATRKRPSRKLRVAVGVGLLVATALAEVAAHELRELPHYDRYELNLPDH